MLPPFRPIPPALLHTPPLLAPPYVNPPFSQLSPPSSPASVNSITEASPPRNPHHALSSAQVPTEGLIDYDPVAPVEIAPLRGGEIHIDGARLPSASPRARLYASSLRIFRRKCSTYRLACSDAIFLFSTVALLVF